MFFFVPEAQTSSEKTEVHPADVKGPATGAGGEHLEGTQK